MKRIRWLWVAVIVVVALWLLVRHQRNNLTDTHGRAANAWRRAHGVPPIDTAMVQDWAFDAVVAAHWQGQPADTGAWHAYKTVVVLPIVTVEQDMYHLNEPGSPQMSLYVKSVIRTSVMQTVLLARGGTRSKVLRGAALDSVVRRWRLDWPQPK